MDPQSGHGAEKENSCICQESHPSRPDCSHVTDWAIHYYYKAHNLIQKTFLIQVLLFKRN